MLNNIKCIYVKIFILMGIKFRGLGEKYKFMDYWIHGFDDLVIQFKVYNPFHQIWWITLPTKSMKIGTPRTVVLS